MYEKISEIPIREEKIKKLKEKILADIDKHLERNRQDMKIFLTNNENIMQDWDFMISQEFTLLRLKDFIKNEYTFWSIEARYEEEDMEEYEEFYEDDLKIEVDNSSKLLEESNTKSMLALVAYVMNSNIKLNVFKKWLVDFFAQNNTYKTNQTENYIYMRDSLQKMIVE